MPPARRARRSDSCVVRPPRLAPARRRRAPGAGARAGAPRTRLPGRRGAARREHLAHERGEAARGVPGHPRDDVGDEVAEALAVGGHVVGHHLDGPGVGAERAERLAGGGRRDRDVRDGPAQRLAEGRGDLRERHAGGARQLEGLVIVGRRGDRRGHRLGDVARVDHRDPGGADARVERAVGARRRGHAEQVLHEERRPQRDVDEAGLAELLLGAGVLARVVGRAVGRRLDRAQAHDLAHAGLLRGGDGARGLLRRVRAGRRDQRERVDAGDGGRQAHRIFERAGGERDAAVGEGTRLGGIADQRADAQVVGLGQDAGEVATDGAGGSGDEHGGHEVPPPSR